MLNKKALAAAVGVPAQYQIERSLRFNSADSAYLTRTPASAGNRKTWTWSGWVKLSSNKAQQLFTCVGSQSDTTSLFIDMLSGGNLRVLGWTTVFRSTSALYRDFSAWYHIVVAFDTTQATANDRIKVYVNGTQVTDFATTNNPTQNTDYGINQASLHEIGRYSISGTGYDYLNGYLTEVNFIDGQALTPSSFGETDTDTGIWKPKAFSGTYGTNGFYLDFSDNSGTTSTTLGKDYSGNSNNFTPNNFSVTAGTGNDSLVDTPTPYGTDTGAGGEVRGNYCTINAIQSSSNLTLSNGNLQISSASSGNSQALGTIGASTGKWYWEVFITTISGGDAAIGIVNAATARTDQNAGAQVDGYVAYLYTANTYIQKANNNTYTNTDLTSPAANDVINFAVDFDAGKFWIGKNGTWANSGNPATGSNATFTISAFTYLPTIRSSGSGSTSTLNANFGQRPFAYTAPSGFKALCTTNLPTPTIGATATTRADDYFDTGLYTGNGSSSSRAISGPNNPDFVWIKSRSGAGSHALYDVIRGFGKRLYSNGTDAEYDYGSTLLTPTSTGFNLTTADADHNTNNTTYVAWQWKGGGTGVSNTAGTITSTVSANTTSGFSIVTWTASGTYPSTTIGHGLGITPAFIITKRRDGTPSWRIWHKNMSATNNEYYYLGFDTDAAGNFGSNYWVAPTSTTFGVQSSGYDNNTGNMVAYCFAPVAGFSAFGSYTGNGSTDGPFIYTGFRPAYVLIKASSSVTYGNWILMDAKRSSFNVADDALYANLSNSEDTTYQLDMLSNGFKIRHSAFDGINGNTKTYIYAAFAENPFKYSLAR